MIKEPEMIIKKRERRCESLGVEAEGQVAMQGRWWDHVITEWNRMALSPVACWVLGEVGAQPSNAKGTFPTEASLSCRIECKGKDLPRHAEVRSPPLYRFLC